MNLPRSEAQARLRNTWNRSKVLRLSEVWVSLICASFTHPFTTSSHLSRDQERSCSTIRTDRTLSGWIALLSSRKRGGHRLLTLRLISSIVYANSLILERDSVDGRSRAYYDERCVPGKSDGGS